LFQEDPDLPRGVETKLFQAFISLIQNSFPDFWAILERVFILLRHHPAYNTGYIVIKRIKKIGSAKKKIKKIKVLRFIENFSNRVFQRDIQTDFF